LSTIRDSDKIIVLKDGVLTEVGNHEELLKNYPEGIYHGFVQKQASAEEGSGPGAKKSIKAVVRAETINKKAGLVLEDDMEIEEEFDPEEKEKLKTMLEKDAIEEEKEKEFEQSIKDGAFSRLIPYNTPFYFIYIAIFFNILDGAASPLFGVIFSKILDILALEIDFEGENPAGLPLADVKSRTRILCILCGVLGFVMFLSNAISKFLFGTVGENVTLAIRKALYKSILEKNIGFFDFRENGASVLTSAMAEDTSIINGVSTESLGPAMDGLFALLVGIGIGFAYSWKVSLICLGLAPLMVLGSIMEMQATQGGANDEEGQKAVKEANLICGDAIVNYKTVQSFGHEELIVNLYERLLTPIRATSTFAHIMSGVGYGFS
jgi:ATP-binding cassette subfamily B (MDR/TAP) protein 1